MIECDGCSTMVGKCHLLNRRTITLLNIGVPRKTTWCDDLFIDMSNLVAKLNQYCTHISDLRGSFYWTTGIIARVFGQRDWRTRGTSLLRAIFIQRKGKKMKII